MAPVRRFVGSLTKKLTSASLIKPTGRRTTSYGARSDIGRCYHLQTPAGVGTICEHAMKKCLKSSGARAILNFAGELQIAEIERRQFYF